MAQTSIRGQALAQPASATPRAANIDTKHFTFDIISIKPTNARATLTS